MVKDLEFDREICTGNGKSLHFFRRACMIELQSFKEAKDLHTIRRATQKDVETVMRLAAACWEHSEPETLREELRTLLAQPSAAIFLSLDGERETGFAQCQLRRDYVEGPHTSPVGYLEGIFVEPAYRRRGCAGELLRACESWAGDQGCTEFASDCELDNADSLAFHRKAGFREANRIICFTKDLTADLRERERKGENHEAF